jgi:hypothetical protein
MWPSIQSQNAAYRAPPSSVSAAILGRVAASISSKRAVWSGANHTAAPSMPSAPATHTTSSCP